MVTTIYYLPRVFIEEKEATNFRMRKALQRVLLCARSYCFGLSVLSPPILEHKKGVCSAKCTRHTIVFISFVQASRLFLHLLQRRVIALHAIVSARTSYASDARAKEERTSSIFNATRHTQRRIITP